MTAVIGECSDPPPQAAGGKIVIYSQGVYMSDDVLDIRADEVARLRSALREVRARIKKFAVLAEENDGIVKAMHKLSLLLLARKPNAQWRGAAEKLLARGLPRVAHCRIVVVAEMTAAQKSKAARLPAGGKNGADAAFAKDGFASAYSLPLKSGRELRGLALFYARKKDAFPPSAASDFALQLGQLLAAAMENDNTGGGKKR